MRCLQMFVPLMLLTAAACGSSAPDGISGDGDTSGGGSMDGPGGGPRPGGPPAVLTPSRRSSSFGRNLALSHDGRVLMVSALRSGEPDAPDDESFPVLAFEAQGGSFAPICQLPGLQRQDVGRQGDLLALNGDGSILAMQEWLGNPSAITVLQRVNGCWERNGFQQEVDVDYDGDFAALSISSDGTTVVAGLPDHARDARHLDTDDFQAGALHVWKPSGDRVVRSPKKRQQAQFGTSAVVTADSTLAFVGEPQFGSSDAIYEPDEPRQHGSAYVIDLKNDGAPAATLNAANWASQAGFGEAVAASADGRYVLVGAPDERSLDEAGTSAAATDPNQANGAVYLFEKDGSTWTQRHMFKPEDPAAASGGQFGQKVAISDDGNTVVVGARFYKPTLTGLPPGAIYIFTRGTGDTWAHRVLDGAAYPLSSFGTVFAIDGSGKTLVVGAPSMNVEESKSQGAVLVYAL